MQENSVPQSLLADFGQAFKAKVLVVLSAYLDERHLPDEHVFSLAGSVFPAERCLTFESEWWDALNKHTPPIKEFKASHCESGHGVFSTWDPLDRYAFRDGLMAVAERDAAVEFRMGVSVDLKAFSSLPPDDRRQLLGFSKPLKGMDTRLPYVLAFWYFQHKMSEFMGHRGPISYFMDAVPSDRGKGKILDEINWLRKRPDEIKRMGVQINRIAWLESKDTPQLQAADMLAYEIAKEGSREFGHFRRPPRVALTRWVKRMKRGQFPTFYLGKDFFDIMMQVPQHERGMRAPKIRPKNQI